MKKSIKLKVVAVKGDEVTLEYVKRKRRPELLDSRGGLMVLAERQRQIAKEGYSIEHDAKHIYGEITRAATCYAHAALRQIGNPGINPLELASNGWPWDLVAWKPNRDVVVNLVKAGALIVAEIDRILEKSECDAWETTTRIYKVGGPKLSKNDPLTKASVGWGSTTRTYRVDPRKPGAYPKGQEFHVVNFTGKKAPRIGWKKVKAISPKYSK